MTEHERRIHDKTIKAYEAYEVDAIASSGVPQIGQNYSAIQQKYIGKAFGGSPSGSPMMNNAKRPNLKEVVSVSPNPYASKNVVSGNGGGGSMGNLPTVSNLMDVKRTSSQLAMAGSMNILSAKGSAPTLHNTQEADEARLQKVMFNMEKEKSLQFRQNTNNRGYGFQQVIKNE